MERIELVFLDDGVNLRFRVWLYELEDACVYVYPTCMKRLISDYVYLPKPLNLDLIVSIAWTFYLASSKVATMIQPISGVLGTSVSMARDFFGSPFLAHLRRPISARQPSISARTVGV